MARTGISIQVTNTVLGSVPKVNANSMLIVEDASEVTDSTLAFSYDTPYMLQSADDLKTLGITSENNYQLFKEVQEFYAPVGGVNNTGTILWIVAPATGGVDYAVSHLSGWVRATVTNGFQYRPRNILFSGSTNVLVKGVPEKFQKVIDALYTEGFATVALITGNSLYDNEGELVGLIGNGSGIIDMSVEKAPMVGAVIIKNTSGGGQRGCVGLVGGYMASVTVGTSIGDASLPSIGTSFYFIDGGSTPCSEVALTALNLIGDKQYIFARTRPPRNGLWFNDGATCEDPITALSTLEAGRTIAAMVDDLRTFFTPYINTRVPVNSAGDIQSTYKQVVLDNARSSVIQPYIESGDISDARIELQAENNDMVGTRTWKVTLAILPAPTLRWINGYVFYVKSLE